MKWKKHDKFLNETKNHDGWEWFNNETAGNLKS